MKTKLILHHLQNLKWSVIRPATAGFLLILALSPVPCALSQIPQGFNYQAIARNGSGNPLTGQTIDVKMGILSDTITPVIVREELFSSIKTNAFGMFTLVIGTGVYQTGSTTNFTDIDWTAKPLYLKTQIKYSGTWKYMGCSKLWAVPYSMVAKDLGGSVDKLKVTGTETSMDSALFEVKNRTGQTVFAVYNEGVRIYVDDGIAKGATKGGFAIGGFGTAKGTSQPLFVVDPDSIRAYLDNNPVKAVKGGFAIGGFDRSKSANQNFLSVSKDSIRMYIDDNLLTKSRKGGFAIGSFNKSKGGNVNYLNVSTDSTGIINPSENRILWYPLKDAFLTGRVLVESKDSVGVNSFASGYESKAKGQYSQALGYQAIARGNYSTSIGYQSMASLDNSFAFGQWAQAKNYESYAFGRGAIAEGFRSFAFGSAGVDQAGNITGVAYAKGDYSFAIGQGSQALGQGSFALGVADTAKGMYSTAFGNASNALGIISTAMGYHTLASGQNSTAMGYFTTASGTYSTAMGLDVVANGQNATAMGGGTVASGFGSFAAGYYTVAPSSFETVIGTLNSLYTPSSTQQGSWVDNDRLFVIGNGPDLLTRRNAMTVLKGGQVGLQSVTSPTYAFELPNDNSIGIGRALANGWDTYSDGRVKTNRKPLLYGISEIMRLNPLSYFHHNSINKDNRIDIETSGSYDIGLIAQEVYEIIPEIVTKPENEEKLLWSISYNKFVPILIKGMQEQQKQIESQQKEIDELKTLVSTLVANQTGQGNK